MPFPNPVPPAPPPPLAPASLRHRSSPARHPGVRRACPELAEERGPRTSISPSATRHNVIPAEAGTQRQPHVRAHRATPSAHAPQARHHSDPAATPCTPPCQAPHAFQPAPTAPLNPRPHHAPNPAKTHPAQPQEFLRRNSYRAREAPLRTPPAQRFRPQPHRPAQAVPSERPSSQARLPLPRSVGEGWRERPSSPVRLRLPLPVGKRRSLPQTRSGGEGFPFPVRLRPPLPVGEGWGEGLPGTASRLTRIAPGHSNRGPNPPKKHPAAPQEFLGRNSYCAREARFPRPSRPAPAPRSPFERPPPAPPPAGSLPRSVPAVAAAGRPGRRGSVVRSRRAPARR